MKPIPSLADGRMDVIDEMTPGLALAPTRWSWRSSLCGRAGCAIATRRPPEPRGSPALWFRRALAAACADVFKSWLAVMTGRPSASSGQSAPSLARRMLQSTPAELDFELAAHEAGHVLASRLLGTDVHHVTVVQNDDLGYAGRAITGSGGFPDLAMHRSTADNHARINKMASIIDRNFPGPGENRDDVASWLQAVHVALIKLMAGAAAEILMIGQANDGRSADDHADAHRLAATVTSSDVSARALMEFAAVEAIEMLRPYASVLTALASELVARRELDGAEIDQVIQAALIQQAHDREMVRRAQWNDLIGRAAAFEKDQPQ
jgi:hypothetical protein